MLTIAGGIILGGVGLFLLPIILVTIGKFFDWLSGILG
jgi:hypothetical protein